MPPPTQPISASSPAICWLDLPGAGGQVESALLGSCDASQKAGWGIFNHTEFLPYFYVVKCIYIFFYDF